MFVCLLSKYNWLVGYVKIILFERVVLLVFVSDDDNKMLWF